MSGYTITISLLGCWCEGGDLTPDSSLSTACSRNLSRMAGYRTNKASRTAGTDPKAVRKTICIPRCRSTYRRHRAVPALYSTGRVPQRGHRPAVQPGMACRLSKSQWLQKRHFGQCHVGPGEPSVLSWRSAGRQQTNLERGHVWSGH
jgi:hypothetical protein